MRIHYFVVAVVLFYFFLLLTGWSECITYVMSVRYVTIVFWSFAFLFYCSRHERAFHFIFFHYFLSTFLGFVFLHLFFIYSLRLMVISFCCDFSLLFYLLHSNCSEAFHLCPVFDVRLLVYNTCNTLLQWCNQEDVWYINKKKEMNMNGINWTILAFCHNHIFYVRLRQLRLFIFRFFDIELCPSSPRFFVSFFSTLVILRRHLIVFTVNEWIFDCARNTNRKNKSTNKTKIRMKPNAPLSRTFFSFKYMRVRAINLFYVLSS